MPTQSATIEISSSISAIPAPEWDRLTNGHPLLSHAFFDGLHRTGCAAANTGWTPQFLLLKVDGKLEGAMPLYLKDHSYGEYVFDWAWADAYERSGLSYYPKLLCAIPFSPVTGQRLLVSDPQYRQPLINAAIQFAEKANLSSFHCLFPSEDEAAEMRERGLLLRTGVQFHWHNAGYDSFDNFLASMNHDKRKKIRQERRKVAEAGITFRWLTGNNIREEDWHFFYRCYVSTYRAHRSTPYLSLEFFLHLGENMADQVLLIVAEQDGKPIASAFNLFNAQTLYGRYWGATTFSSGLHFETCYYQALEFCIERGIDRFEGGAQGEHKLARGFTPVKTLSVHWLARPEFSSAVEHYLARETTGMATYIDELTERQPFKTP
ncbi:MAG: GNAT family N-acetyltransferase [Pseudomonadota bacterium]